jgi:hypothetical protein
MGIVDGNIRVFMGHSVSLATPLFAVSPPSWSGISPWRVLQAHPRLSRLDTRNQEYWLHFNYYS